MSHIGRSMRGCLLEFSHYETFALTLKITKTGLDMNKTELLKYDLDCIFYAIDNIH